MAGTADFKISVSLDARDTKAGTAEVKSAMKSLASDAEKTGRQMKSLAKVNFKEVAAHLRGLGNTLQQVGATLSKAVTLPLLGLATLGIRSALEMDKVRTKLTALLGDSEKANQKLLELQTLAANSVGVTQKAAFEGFAQLKGIGGIADETINKIIASLGKLNAAFTIDDQAGFQRNLVQIFSQGFEIADIKEAIGRVPIFRQLLSQAFGTDDPAKLKALKDAGKLTLDNFLSGISTAINNDPRIGNIQENLTVKMSKAFERMNVALAPLGQVILDVVVPAIEKLSPYVQKLGDWFNSLSPTVKAIVVGFGALAAALGPVLIVIGSVMTTIASLITAGTTGGIVILAVVGFLIQLGLIFGVVAAEAYVLYQAWQTNFGGIRDTTLEVWDAIKSATQAALDAIKAFWNEHGASILATVRAVWGTISTFVETIVRQIGNIIKIVLRVIRGDWAGAWEALLDYTKTAGNLIGQIVKAQMQLLVKFFFDVLPALARWAVTFQASLVKWLWQGIAAAVVVVATLPQRLVAIVPAMIAAGRSIGSALWQGLRQAFASASGTREGGGTIAAGVGGVGGEGGGTSLGIGLPNIAGLGGGGGGRSGGGGGLSAAQQQAEDLQDRIKELQLQIQFFGKDSQEAAEKQRLLGQGIDISTNALAQEAIGLAKNLDQLKERADFLKRHEETTKAYAETNEKALAAIKNDEYNRALGLREELQGLTEKIRLGRELTDVEKQQNANQTEYIRLTDAWRNAGLMPQDIKILQSILAAEQKRTLEILKQIAAAKEKYAVQQRYQGLIAGQGQTIAELNAQLSGNTQLTELNRIQQLLLTDAYKGLTDKQKSKLLTNAQEIDALRETLKAQQEAQRQYDELHNAIRESLGILADQGFGAFFKSIYRRFKQWLLDLAAEWLTSKFFKLLSGVGGGAQQGQGSAGGTGGLQSIFQTIFGGGRGSSSSSGAGGGWGSPGSGSSVPSLGSPASGGSSSSSGGFAGHAMPGYVSAISAGGGILGGMIGGTWGNVISMASTGLGIGWMIGGPIGGAIGAGVGALGGFLASLFGGDPKRKKDKKENLPALQKGFLEAIADLERLKNDRMAIYNDPDGTLSRARDIRAQIAAGFGIEFLSKKYRKVAQQQISQKLIEADKLIAELEQIAGTYKYARQVDERIVTSFAGGVFMSPAFMKQFGDFKRRNGFLGGRFTGSDTLPSMLAPGEMVLNPYQVGRVKANAGMDPFARAGIPGYTTGAVVSSAPQPMTAANMGGQIVVQPQISVTIEGEGITDARIKSVVVDGVKDPDFQVELVRAYDKGKTRGTRGY